MALTGYEKSLEQYSKNELVDIAKKYTIYYQTDSGQGSISNYGSLTKEKLISLIKSDRNYQSAAPPTKKLSRVEIMMQRITPGFDTEDEIMEVIQEVVDDIDSIDISKFKIKKKRKICPKKRNLELRLCNPVSRVECQL